LRRLLVFSSLLLIALGLSAQKNAEFEVSLASAEVTISGNTNVNRFVCALSLDSPMDTLLIETDFNSDTLQFSGMFLKFPIEAFQCKIKLMNRDFQSFLMSDVYPELLMSIEQMIINRGKSVMEKVSVKSRVSINLCGTNRKYEIRQGYVMERPDGTTQLVCNEVVRFTEFGLTPPSKFFGTINVEDELEITLDLTLRISQT
jgi:hypothetical protein